ncbi:MAG TPA: adenylate/guanylate cyclase domain-containing protein [Acidimicrobiales bacterium]|nr:adenylate/guanylate cyclase domain-containing protein [Acidimicrobiales bacterium]
MPHFGYAMAAGGYRVAVLAAPSIEFAEHGDTHLAFQVTGENATEIVYVGGSFATTLAWEEPAYAKGLRRLASFSRLVTYDQRGMGYSDPLDQTAMPSLDDLVEDLAAVIAAAGVTEPVLFGSHNGGAVAVAYAVKYPVRRLVLCNTWARLSVDDDYPIGFSDQILDNLEERYRREWGQGRIVDWFATPRADVAPRRFELASTSRNQAVALFRINREYDIRPLLPLVRVPTLVIHLEDNLNVPRSFGRYIAESIPGARLVFVPGTDQMFLRNYAFPVIDEVERFVTGSLTLFADRMITTMLFTDIVDSTPRAATLGDTAWSTMIDDHNDRMRQEILAHGGDEVKCTGDGFLVAFDNPASAIRCARGAMQSVADLGLELRAGVHVGEVTRMGRSDVSGLAVHFAQRLCARAGGGQVLTSEAAMERCEGYGISFEDGGTTTLKGIPGEWHIFSVTG